MLCMVFSLWLKRLPVFISLISDETILLYKPLAAGTGENGGRHNSEPENGESQFEVTRLMVSAELLQRPCLYRNQAYPAYGQLGWRFHCKP